MKKILFTISLIFVLTFTTFAEKPDYLYDVDLNALNKRMEAVINYDNKPYVTQTELPPPNILSFKDGTTINRVLVLPTDTKRLNKIAITIDDSFTDKYTEELLDVLDLHGCKTTFFITSKLLYTNPSRIFEIISRGHEIANHSMTHAPFKNLHIMRKQWELNTLNQYFKTLTYNNMTLCRYPTGSYDREAINVAVSYNMYPIGWSVDSRDYYYKDGDKVYNYTIAQKVESGSILLFHNGYSFSRDLFDKLLTYYESQGFSFAKVSDLIYTDNFVVEKGIQKLVN